MGNNKIVFAGETLIDLTGDTVSEGNLLEGTIAHDSKGDTITGTMKKMTVSDDGEGNVSIIGTAIVAN